MALSAEAAAVRALMAAGVPSKLVERAIRTITIEEHDESDTLAAKVADVKADLPALSVSRSHRRRTGTSGRLPVVRRCRWTMRRKSPQDVSASVCHRCLTRLPEGTRPEVLRRLSVW